MNSPFIEAHGEHLNAQTLPNFSLTSQPLTGEVEGVPEPILLDGVGGLKGLKLRLRNANSTLHAAANAIAEAGHRRITASSDGQEGLPRPGHPRPLFTFLIKLDFNQGGLA